MYNEFPWYTEGTTGFVDVRDVANAMILLMQSDITAEKFILSAENISYKDMFTMMAQAFNKKVPAKKVTPFIAAVTWRLEDIKSKFTGVAPLLTKETANTALTKVEYDNRKLLNLLPGFKYTPMEQSVKEICSSLMQKI